jgi:hypothetical protein
MAYDAVKLLVQTLDGVTAPELTTFPVSLIPGDTA